MKELPTFRIGGEKREFLMVEVISRSYPQCYDFWDGNWLAARIRVSVGAFTGDYRASLRSDEFAHFLSSLRLVQVSLGTEIPTHVAEFTSTEDQLSLVVRGNGRGDFVAECVAVDEPGVGNRLEFELTFDRTFIPAMLDDLASILAAFPVVGKP